MSYSTFELEKMKLMAQTIISRELAEDFANAPEVRSGILDYVTGSMVLQVRQEVYGRQLDEVKAEWPADWWQAFKARWLPAWALRRWPIKMHAVILEARELYPKLAAPNLAPVLWLHRHDDERLES